MTSRPLNVINLFIRSDATTEATTQPDIPAAEQATTNQQPSWNASTTVVCVIRDRLHDSLPPVTEPGPPIYGPAPQLEQRPLDLGEGWWR